MKNVLRSSVLFVSAVLASGVFVPATFAQREGTLPTQVLVNVDAKSTAPANASDLTVEIGGHKLPVSSWTPVDPARTQVAVLIDDGLRESVGRELHNLQVFVQSLPSGVEVLIGYMENGHVIQVQPFTTDTETAATKLRLPMGMAGISASPYICLSDFVKHWPGEQAVKVSETGTTARDARQTPPKARFVLMITDGVDPYNGRPSITNETSPYVDTAIRDTQKAGVAVYSMYYSDAGLRGDNVSLSGQSYLQMLADGTGAQNYFEGTGNPVSMAPFLNKFKEAIAKTYIASFDAPAGKNPSQDMVAVKLTSASKTKLHVQKEVLPGNIE